MTGFDGDEDTPHIIVQESIEDDEEIDDLSKDRSYMLSYIISKHKDPESTGNF